MSIGISPTYKRALTEQSEKTREEFEKIEQARLYVQPTQPKTEERSKVSKPRRKEEGGHQKEQRAFVRDVWMLSWDIKTSFWIVQHGVQLIANFLARCVIRYAKIRGWKQADCKGCTRKQGTQ